MRYFRLFLVVLPLAPAAGPLRAADGPVVYRGAKVYTAAGAPIEKGVLVVHKG